MKPAPGVDPGRHRLTPAAGLLALLLLAAPCAAYDPLTWYTFDGGGALGAISGVYRLSGTAGQPDAGVHCSGNFVLRGGFWHGGGTLPSAVESGATASVFRFFPVAPNPILSGSRLSFELPAVSAARLRIFNVSGRAVRSVDLGLLQPGRHTYGWTAQDDLGRPLAGGGVLPAPRGRGKERAAEGARGSMTMNAACRR